MSFDYDELSGEAIRESGKREMDDDFMRGKNYFSCGYSHQSYYNHTYAIAITIVGKIYGSNCGGNSYYHKGIAYVSKELGISKRQVKSHRKKYKVHNGYEFKTPYTIPDIVGKMIALLQQNENNEMVRKMVEMYNEPFYRTLLVGEQYDEIRNAASGATRSKVLEVEGRMDYLTQKFGG